MNNIFQKRRARLLAMKALRGTYLPPEQIITCPGCGQESPRREVADNLSVCPKCGYHWPVGAYYRLGFLLDAGSFRELDPKLPAENPLSFPGYPEKLQTARRRTGLSEAVVTAVGAIQGQRCVTAVPKLPAENPLSFPGYPEKLQTARRRTGLSEAVVTAVGAIQGQRCVTAVLDSRFLMGSMSAAVGEKLTLAVEYAGRNRLPLIIFSASGGARMQEGILSLMQMAKTSAALARFSEKGLLYLSVLTDPTTGGVTASFASLGDIILAEPGALIGFAGPRVIEQTIGQQLPEGFQRAEFMMEHGFVDAIVPRARLREVLGQLLMLHGKGGRHG